MYLGVENSDFAAAILVGCKMGRSDFLKSAPASRVGSHSDTSLSCHYHYDSKICPGKDPL